MRLEIPNMDTAEQIARFSQTKTQMMDLLVCYLEQLGVEYVFGVPGGAIEPLYNALARSKRRGSVKAIVARHETGAAFMAAGYATNSGKLGVCCSTTGPGATNLITGVSSAYQNNVPILVITPQTMLENFGRGALQESSCTGINTVGMFEFCTTYNTLVSHVNQFERKLCSAITSAFQSSRPAHLSIPLDIQRHDSCVAMPSYDLSWLLHTPALMDIESVEQLRKRLLTSHKVVFVLGDGCRRAIGLILSIAAMLNAEIVSTPHGKGIISPYHPLFRGVIGFAGHRSATEVLSNPDVDSIVAIGTALSEWASNGWDVNTLLNTKLIHVDSARNHFMHSPMAGLHVYGDIAHVFEKILNGVFSRKFQTSNSASDDTKGNSVVAEEKLGLCRYFSLEEEDKFISDAVPIKPQRLMHELPKLFPSSTRYLADPGNSLTWAIHYLHPYDRRLTGGDRDAKGGLFQSSLEFASMGWSIGAAIGAALAEPHYPVVCLVGDGSILMSGQEVTVATMEKLTVIFIILNDAALGMVKHGQRLANAEPIAFELPEVDYALMGNAMGVPGYVIRSPKDLHALDIKKICARKGPTLLDVRVDSEEVPPMNARMKVLGSVEGI